MRLFSHFLFVFFTLVVFSTSVFAAPSSPSWTSMSPTSKIKNSGTTTYMSWGGVSGASYYEVWVNPPNGGWYHSRTTSGTSESFNPNYLGTYAFAVKACNSSGCSGYSSSSYVTVQNPPPPPPPVPAHAPSIYQSAYSKYYGTSDSLTVSWSSVSHASYYRVWVNSPNGGRRVAGDVNGTSRTATPGYLGTYYYSVSACNESGCGPESSSIAFTVEMPPPPKPSASPSLSQNSSSKIYGTSDSLNLSWSSVSHATYYKVWVDPPNDAKKLAANVNGNSRSSTPGYLGTYYYSVSACNESGCGPESGSIQYEVKPPIPGAPSISQSAHSKIYGSSASLTVSWNSVGHATSYQVWVDAPNAAKKLAETVSGTSRTATPGYLGTYTYTVKACNATGCSAESNAIQFEVKPPVPAAPSISQSAHSKIYGSSASLTVSWNSVGHATSYQVWVDAPNAAKKLAETVSGTSRTATPGYLGTYTYTVKACNATGCSTESNAIQFEVKPPVPAAPSISQSASSKIYGSSDTLTVSWASVDYATSYEVWVDSPNESKKLAETVSATSRTATPGYLGTYTYTVKACNATGCSAESNAIQFEVKPPVPVTPVAAINTGTRTKDSDEVIIVSWGTVEHASYYQVLMKSTHEDDQLFDSLAVNEKSLSPNQLGSYTVSVKACNNLGCSEESDGLTLEVVAPALSIPSSVSLNKSQANRSDEVTLSWDIVPEATEYEVWIDSPLRENYLSRSIQETSVIFHPTQAGEYLFTVRACNEPLGCSEFSNQVSLQLQTPLPEIVSLSYTPNPAQVGQTQKMLLEYRYATKCYNADSGFVYYEGIISSGTIDVDRYRFEAKSFELTMICENEAGSVQAKESNVINKLPPVTGLSIVE